MPDYSADMFDKVRLPPELDTHLRRANPWWEDKPGRVVPTYQRWAFAPLLRRLESPLAPIIVLRGARQVGKTTLQEQLIQHLLCIKKVAPQRILRVQFDELPSLRGLKEPIPAIVRWFENRILGRTLNESAHAGEIAYLFIDEAQNLADWAPQLKALVDHHTVQVCVTGSSALRIEAGRDSLAGRITMFELGTLLLREIAGLHLHESLPSLVNNGEMQSLLDSEFWRGLESHGAQYARVRDAAFALFSRQGGYPLAYAQPSTSWPEIADQLNETIIRRVIQHDLRLGDRGRKRDPQLLEEVFRLGCRYAGQAPAPATLLVELKAILKAEIGWQRVHSYLRFLEGSLLLRIIRPLEIRLKKTRGSAKLCVVDHGLRQSWLGEIIRLDPNELVRLSHLADLAGHIAESVVGSYLCGFPHLDVTHFPERATEPEVDFVLTLGERRIPLEVKYRRHIDPFRDTFGLRAFIEKAHYNAPFGILVTMQEGVQMDDPRIIPVSLRSLLLMR